MSAVETPEKQAYGTSRADRLTSFNVEDFPVPTGREEDWRFTPIRRVQHLFDPANYDEGDAPFTVETSDAEVTVVTVDRDDPSVEAVLKPCDRAAAVAWNQAATTTVISVPRDAVLKEPIRVTVEGATGLRAQHLSITVGVHAEATIILSHRGSAEASVNQTVEVNAGDGSHVTLVTLQEWDPSVVYAANQRLAVGRDATLTHIAVSLGGSVNRICADTDFRGPGGKINMLGAYFADAGQHMEHRVFVNHRLPNCYSRVTYKGALQGKGAHIVWVGDCFIGKDADNTDSYESNRNLALTDGTQADSVPNLEIESGEIQGAGHASATGRFDPEELFYLMSRGIPENQARRLVVRGFFNQVIEQIENKEIEDHLMAAIDQELDRTATLDSILNPQEEN